MSSEKKIIKIRLPLAIILFLGLIADLFYFSIPTDLRLFTLLLIWIIVVRAYRMASSSTFKLTLLLFVLLFISFLFKRESILNERISTWIYLLLATGVIHQFFEFKQNKKRRYT
ncbi:hypothetical protein M1146_00995 [Patescibacteria group bacterium]|nr:hypothetical protein [Patescibacteria group bacterium]